MLKKHIHIREELQSLKKIILSLDKKVVVIFLSIAILQTISYYFTSRMFFRQNFYDQLISNPNYQSYELGYWFISDSLTYLVIPILIIKIVLKSNLKDFGLQVGDYKLGLFLAVLFILIMIPINWFSSTDPAFAATYPLLEKARDSWSIFIFYELGLLLYLIAWEFIWRGFTLFGLKEKFGYYSVLIQMIPFLILHDGKPFAETFGAIFGGIALGILAYRTRSIFYCVIAHAGIMFSIDLISILRYRSGDFGIGFSSIIHLLKVF